MSQTYPKLESLAIDALVQFRAGVNEVLIGETSLTATQVYEAARYSELENDEENIIYAIKVLLAFSKITKDTSVEVIA